MPPMFFAPISRRPILPATTKQKKSIATPEETTVPLAKPTPDEATIEKTTVISVVTTTKSSPDQDAPKTSNEISMSKSKKPSPDEGAVTVRARKVKVMKPASGWNDVPSTKLTSLEGGIKVTDVPQWLWTNKECRAWISKIFVTYIHWSPEVAVRKSGELNCFGPGLYMMTDGQWITYLGHWPGKSVYAMLLAMRHCEGAVPSHIDVGHG